MPRRVLVTGGSGFVGQWLCRLLLERGFRVFAGTIEGPPPTPLLTRSELDSVCWLPLDVASAPETRRAVAEAKPDDVVHLAGIAFPPDANADPARTYDVNALGVMRLMDALLDEGGSDRRVLVVGTADQYGPHPASEQPLSEDAAIRPLTPYAGSKAAQEVIALRVARGTGLKVVATRSFNHSGEGHGAQYLLPSLVGRGRSLAKQGGTLRMGNASPIRDYLHVADVVEAYALLLDRGEDGEVYNVSSGEGTTVRELANRVLNRLNVSATIVEDPALVRPTDVPMLVGDSSKLRRATGWTPQRTTDDIIDDLIHAASR